MTRWGLMCVLLAGCGGSVEAPAPSPPDVVVEAQSEDAGPDVADAMPEAAPPPACLAKLKPCGPVIPQRCCPGLACDMTLRQPICK